MTGSRYPGLPSGTEPGALDTSRQPPNSPSHQRSVQTLTHRLTDHASHDVAVKATPLPGRPSGPRLDPDAASARPTPKRPVKEEGPATLNRG